LTRSAVTLRWPRSGPRRGRPCHVILRGSPSLSSGRPLRGRTR